MYKQAAGDDRLMTFIISSHRLLSHNVRKSVLCVCYTPTQFCSERLPSFKCSACRDFDATLSLEINIAGTALLLKGKLTAVYCN